MLIKLIILMGLSMLSVNSYSGNEQKYIEESKNALDAASVWTIESGIEEYLNKGEESFIKILMSEFSVLLWTVPSVETSGILATFRLKRRGIHYHVHNLHREFINDSFYEFWIVKISGTNWAGVSNKTRFYVTSIDRVNSKRKIILESDQFIEKYENNKIKFVFPLDDMSVLYAMEAWFFEENYRGTNLPKRVVIMDSQGKYQYASLLEKFLIKITR